MSWWDLDPTHVYCQSESQSVFDWEHNQVSNVIQDVPDLAHNEAANEVQAEADLGQSEAQQDDELGHIVLVEEVEFLEDEYILDEDDEIELEVNTSEPSKWWASVDDFCNQGDLENSDSGYENDDDLQSLDSEDEYGETKVKRSRKQFIPTNEWSNFEFSLGLEFASVAQLREAIKEYFIATDKEFIYIFNHPTKVQVVCKAKGCGWSLYARVQKRDHLTFRVNSLNNVHDCGIVYDNKHVDATWLAKHFENEFRMNPNMHYTQFMELTANSKFSNTKRHVFYNAKKKARHTLEGSVAQQYIVLDDYCKQLVELNPGSTAIIKSRMVDHKRLFERVYICIKPCKDGFKACRPLIGLDGCFLKGYCKGMLLAAIGIDADNSIFPIAYAVCEKENTDTWTWFLNLLKEDLEPIDVTKITMMSDRQKGLEKAQASTFEGAEVRFCVRHLYSNFKKEFPGLLLKQKLWACARATTPEDFTKKMAELKEVNEKAYEWLIKKKPSEWSKSHFRFFVKCDMLLNNLCESFNSAILDAREKPIVTLLEKLRFWLMSKRCVKRESVSKWVNPVGKRVTKIIEKNKQVARRCSCTRADSHTFEVSRSGIEKFSVDLVAKKCTCRGYQLTGIPCGHALSAICSFGLNEYDFVDDVYKKEAYIAQYVGEIYPMPSPDKWPNPGQNPIYPPTNSVLPGRLKKARNRDVDEPPAPNATKMRRFGQVNTCGNCGKQGHSRRTCKISIIVQPTTQKNKGGRPLKKSPTEETVKRKKRRAKQG